MRSFGVERSLKRACVGNEAAVSPMTAEAFSGGARPSRFCSKKRKKRIFREWKIRIKTVHAGEALQGPVHVDPACFCRSRYGTGLLFPIALSPLCCAIMGSPLGPTARAGSKCDRQRGGCCEPAALPVRQQGAIPPTRKG